MQGARGIEEDPDLWVSRPRSQSIDGLVEFTMAGIVPAAASGYGLDHVGSGIPSLLRSLEQAVLDECYFRLGEKLSTSESMLWGLAGHLSPPKSPSTA